MAAKFALVALSVALTLVAGEVLVRLLPTPQRFLSAEEIWRAQRTRSEVPAVRDGIEIGGVTFREEALPERAFASAATRLLFLGDSFTVGAGLERREDRFSDRVEAALDAERSGGVFAFNAGRGGSNPDQWSSYLLALMPVVKPHAVFAVFFLRDGTLLGTSLQLNKREIAPILARTRSRPLYGTSALLSFFWDRLAWREYTALFTEKLKRAYLGSYDERAMWRRQQRALLAMAARCRSESVPFHLVVFPLLFELDRYAFDDVEAEIRQFAERNSIPVFSLTPAFLGKQDHDLWVASNDQHPNALGHHLAAERLLPYVRESVLGAGAVR
ncbi:MAG: SGNH/GDSL hydrolase family protein [Deltaproteobacteria bacterium]|nr:SGNH/GDSL hydrolase family protein [Deltaproteobacteria bacterium]MBW2361025.1 SGNH/GDSL hydrolase family protein [Deltaproteobacteria bacterium]